MLGQLFITEILPVLVLEIFVDTLDVLGLRRHRLVVTVMEHIEFLGADQFLEHVFIFLKNVFHDSVSLVDHTVGRLIQAVAPKTFLVLENFQRLGIAEELTEKAQLADGHVRGVFGPVFVLQDGIDKRSDIPPGEQALDLTLVVLASIEATASG